MTLRQYAEQKTADLFPEDAANVDLVNSSTYELLQRLEDMLLALKPANPRDQWWLGQAMTLAAKIGDTRWLLAQQLGRELRKRSSLSSSFGSSSSSLVLVCSRLTTSHPRSYSRSAPSRKKRTPQAYLNRTRSTIVAFARNGSIEAGGTAEENRSSEFSARIGWSAATSLVTSTAVPGIRARIASRCNLGQPVEVMRPAFCVAGALFGTGQARMDQAQQRSVRLLHQVDLDQARRWRHHLAAVPAEAISETVHALVLGCEIVLAPEIEWWE